MSSSRRARSRRIKRILANLFVAVLAFLTLVLLVGLFLPHQYHVERTIDIRARPEVIYADLANLRRWPEWTVWNERMDPSVQFTYESPDTGAGAAYRWTGNKLGRGQLKLTNANPTNGVDFQLEFDDGSMTSTGTIRFTPEGEAVRVVWVNEGDLGKSPINRYFGLWMDSMLGDQFDKGLANLKARAEGEKGK